MTLKEADECARKLATPYHNEIRYRRIKQIGYDYDEFGKPRPFVTLEDRNRHSQTICDPKDVTAEEEGK